MIYFIAGQSGVGKTTVARVLKEKLEKEGYTVIVSSFESELLKHVGIINARLGYVVQQAEAPVDVPSGIITWQGAIKQLGYEKAYQVYPEMAKLKQRYDLLIRESFGRDYWADCAYQCLLMTDQAHPLRPRDQSIFRNALIFEDCPTETDFIFMVNHLRDDGFTYKLWVVAGRGKPLNWAMKYEHWVVHNVEGLEDIPGHVDMCLHSVFR